jgi:hypothetical protein
MHDRDKGETMRAVARELWLVVPVVLALLVSAPLWADEGEPVDNTIDIATGLPAIDIETTPLPDNDPVYNVLWDLTHGVYLGYEPSGYYSNLVGLLAGNGYVTTTTSAGIANIDLSPYDIIVITVLSAWNSPYTAAEVAAIQSFMAGGGAVLVMSDNTACPNANVNPVTQPFGVTCGVSSLSPGDLYFTNFAAHPIFAGVTTIYYRVAGELSAGGPGIPLAWTDAGNEVIASVEPCRMIVTSDGNFCDNTYMSIADNQQFALNVFGCLASGISPVEDATWGTIKALYR